MNNFKKINDTQFFIVIDTPLHRTQCAVLVDMLPDYVVSVNHDGYGSFVVELEEGVEQTDELYEEIWQEGEDLFLPLHQIQFYDVYIRGETTSEAWDSYISLLEQCFYTYTPESVVEALEEIGYDKAELEKYATLEHLKLAV